MGSSINSSVRVAIILGYFNGQAYFSEQIRSILDQTHHNFEVFISDDHSDLDIDIDALNLPPEDVKKIHVNRRQKNVGFAFNFLEALASVDDSFEYFAFSDQDDIWYQDKLERALAVLERYPNDQPLLYGASTTITDETGQADLGTSPIYTKPPFFANALIQNIAGGNTMVFNKVARDLIVASALDSCIFFHDWWCYQIISGTGGIVYYDPKPCLKYRQHGRNVVGFNNSFFSRLARFSAFYKGKYKTWHDMHFAALQKNKALLSEKSQHCLNNFIMARQSGLIKRLFLCQRAGIYRQTFLNSIGFLLGIVLNKV